MLTVFMLTVNIIGVAVAALLVTVAFPVPSVFHDVPRWLTFAVAPAYAVAALAFGSWWITTRTVNDLRWAIDGRPPTRADQRNAFFTPWRIAVAQLLLWAVGTAAFTILYGMYDTDFIPRLALGVGFCGVLVATSAYLFTEFALAAGGRPGTGRRPAAAPPGPGHHGPHHDGLDAGLGCAGDRHRPDGAVLADAAEPHQDPARGRRS